MTDEKEEHHAEQEQRKNIFKTKCIILERGTKPVTPVTENRNQWRTLIQEFIQGFTGNK